MILAHTNHIKSQRVYARIVSRKSDSLSNRWLKQLFPRLQFFTRKSGRKKWLPSIWYSFFFSFEFSAQFFLAAIGNFKLLVVAQNSTKKAVTRNFLLNNLPDNSVDYNTLKNITAAKKWRTAKSPVSKLFLFRWNWWLLLEFIERIVVDVYW